MEDSFEDYIKVIRNTKGDINKPTQQELREKDLITLQRKKECESRAIKIVQFLIEGKLQPEVFLRCLKHINQSYYQDIVEERAIEKCCGYPLCGKQIPEMPKKQYFIDTKNNKVYDVTDRKNYCSNFCYKASVHIKEQVDNSPLWLRNIQNTPQFNLLPATERGIPGEEVSQILTIPIKQASFTSVSSFAQISLDEMAGVEGKDKNTHKGKSKSGKRQQFMDTVPESNELDESATTESSSSVTSTTNEVETSATNINPSTSSSITVQVQANKSTHKVAQRKKCESGVSSSKSKSKTKNESSKEVLENIKKYVLEWITLETYIFLYGEARVKEYLPETQLQEYFARMQLQESTALQKRRYLEICRKLSLSQLVEDKFDRMVTGDKIKPIPDFKTIKEEGKTMDLKVRSFYGGIPYTLEDKKIYTNKNEGKTEEQETENTEEGSPAVLPLVDVNSQTAIRRKIYLNSAKKSMLTLIQNLGLPSHSVLDDLQLLVKTFKLQAHNVVFKPTVWTLISLILIKMLSIRDQNLRRHLETKRTESIIKLMLDLFPNAEILLDELFENICDVNSFLNRQFLQIS